MNSKKLKYVVEARLPFPSRQHTLCVRAEGNDNDLRSIAFAALLQLFQLKIKQLDASIHRLVTHNRKKFARKRGADGRYMKNPLSVSVPKNLAIHRERLRLVNTYEAILFNAGQPRIQEGLKSLSLLV